MKLDRDGYQFIRDRESFQRYPYQDQAGIFTIGYGHTAGVSKETPPIDNRRANDLLEIDVVPFEKEISQTVQVPITQNQFNALVSFVFNLGISKFRISTLLRKLNSGDIQGAAREFDRWVHYRDPKTKDMKVSSGLQERRLLEKELFLRDFLAKREKSG